MNSLSGDMRCDPSRNIHFVPFRPVAWDWLLVTFHELKTEPSLWGDGLGISLLSTWNQDRKRSITTSYPHSLGFYNSARLTPPTTGNRSNNTNQKKVDLIPVSCRWPFGLAGPDLHIFPLFSHSEPSLPSLSLVFPGSQCGGNPQLKQGLSQGGGGTLQPGPVTLLSAPQRDEARAPEAQAVREGSSAGVRARPNAGGKAGRQLLRRQSPTFGLETLFTPPLLIG